MRAARASISDPRAGRVRDDLRGLVRGDLRFDDLSRTLYSTDASLFQVVPLGVVAPADEDDVRALVRYAAENQIPLIPRGAGTGVAGEALGDGLIVDLSRHLRGILEVTGDTVRVQPGVVYRSLAAELAIIGRRFAPDPASGDACTIGGMLATNASGSRAFLHGYTRDYLLTGRVVLDNGEAVTVGCEPIPSATPPPADDGTATEPGPRFPEIVRAAADLVASNAELIHRHRPMTPFNRCGYRLDDVLGPDFLDVARLLVGSEGTLAVFTEATLRTVPLAGGRAVVLLGFTSLEAALKTALVVRDTGPAACELLDRRLLSLARRVPEYTRLVPPAAEAVLLVEYETDSAGEARTRAIDLTERVRRAGGGGAVLAPPALAPGDIDRLWRLREAALPNLYDLGDGPRPLAFIEDVGVPPERLAEYLTGVQDVLQRHETTASFLVHTLTGQVHTRPFLDLANPADALKLEPIAEEVHTLALELGGTVSTQHGTGLARTPWVARQYGPLYGVFRQLKRIFDPAGVFNPGKIIGPAPDRPRWPLREPPPSIEPPRANGKPVPVALPVLTWPAEELVNQVAACNGCGHCRTESPQARMCPLFRVTHAEEATPRAKANLLRHLLQPEGDPRRMSAADVRAVADLCINCKMCATECPAHVDVPRLMLETKAANVAEHGLDRSEWVLARTETFAALGSNFSLVVNPLLGNRVVRWLLERVFGISRRGRLPSFTVWNFLRRARRRGWTRKPTDARGPMSDGEPTVLGFRTDKVAYFVDVFANYNDPTIGEATVRVLRHNGIGVFVPPGQVGCGMAAFAQGDVETAREAVQHNLRVFADLAREGYTIVCSEPTAAVMLRQDAPSLLDDADTRLIAERTVELTTFLGELHRKGLLRTDFQPIDAAVGHHVPCHVKALGRPPAGPGLLSLIPQLRVHTIDVSCSGMAGTFGLRADSHSVSLEAGRPMLDELRRPRVLFGSTECSACRLRMEDGSGKRTLHPVQYLALAYGLMPQLAGTLRRPLRGLVSS